MPSGPGSLDAQGVWKYGEADTQALASDLLNLGQTSVSTQFAADRARLGRMEGRASREVLPVSALNTFTNPTAFTDFPITADKNALAITGFIKSGTSAQTVLLVEIDCQLELNSGVAQSLDVGVAVQLGAGAFTSYLAGRRYFAATGRQGVAGRFRITGLGAGTYNIKPQIRSGAAAVVNLQTPTDWFGYTISEIPV